MAPVQRDLTTVFNIIGDNQGDVDNNGGLDNGGEVNKGSNSQIVNNVFEGENLELSDTVIHIGGGDSVFQEIVAVSTVTPPREDVNDLLYEEQQLEEEEELGGQGGVLAPLYLEVSHDFPLSESASGYPPPVSIFLSEHSRWLLSFHLSLFPGSPSTLFTERHIAQIIILSIIVSHQPPNLLPHHHHHRHNPHHYPQPLLH